MMRLVHPVDWRCANGYLEHPYDSFSQKFIAFCKYDDFTPSGGSGPGKIIIRPANLDRDDYVEVAQTVKVYNQLYGAFHNWIQVNNTDFLVFADQQNSATDVGNGYICDLSGATIAEFDGVPRTISPDGMFCAYSNHESQRTEIDCSLKMVDMWNNRTTTLAARADFEGIYSGALPTDWDDIGTKHCKWSPNGRFLAVTYVHEPDSSLFRRMAMFDFSLGRLVDLFDYVDYHHQIWHPNGYEMCMVNPGSPSKYVAYNVLTNTWRDLIDNVNGTSSHGTISPDGLKVATDNTVPTGPVDIFTLGVSSPASKRRIYSNIDLSASADVHPHTQWSRDSKRILFNSESGRLVEWTFGGTAQVSREFLDS